jgi:hypothetical protein
LKEPPDAPLPGPRRGTRACAGDPATARQAPHLLDGAAWFIRTQRRQPDDIAETGTEVVSTGARDR